MKKLIPTFIFLFFMIPLANAQIKIEPSGFQINLVGGESISKTITLLWKGEAPVVAYLNYSIEQINGTFNGSEMWLNFSQNPVILEPNKDKEIGITIHTKPNIYPGEYLIIINANTSIEQITKTKTEVRRSVIYKYINVTNNVTVPENVTVVKWYENTTKIKELQDEINELENRLSYYKNVTEYMENVIKKQDEVINRDKIGILVLLIVVFVFVPVLSKVIT